MRDLRWVAGAACVLAYACGTSVETVDARLPRLDAAVPDGRVVQSDGGQGDGGHADVGQSDGGQSDGGRSDGGDAGPTPIPPSSCASPEPAPDPAAGPICEAISGARCYYVASDGNDANEGSFEAPFASLQRAIEAMSPGDFAYLRGGRHAGRVEIPHDMQGAPDRWYTVKSYPREWAVLDAQYAASCPVIGYGSAELGCGHASGSVDRAPRYWRFEHFEVTGGGTGSNADDGGGLRFDTGQHLQFRYLFVHDNHGNGINNNGGLVVANDDGGTAQHILVENSWFRDNACTGNHNCGNVVLFSDYVENPVDVDIAGALQSNIVRCNLIEGSSVGIKYKNSQWLSLDHTGMHRTHEALGDRIYRNVIRSASDYGIDLRQDFAHIFENVVVDSEFVSVGEAYSSDRNPFHVFVYNNLLIRTRLEVAHDGPDPDGSSYGPPLHPNVYIYNNILDVGLSARDGRNDLSIAFTFGDWSTDDLEMETVHVERNLFYRRAEDAITITLANRDDRSASAYVRAGYSDLLWSSEAPGLYFDEARYSVDPSFVLSGGLRVADGGLGGGLPSYVGPTGSLADGEGSWIDSVLALTDAARLVQN